MERLGIENGCWARLGILALCKLPVDLQIYQFPFFLPFNLSSDSQY